MNLHAADIGIIFAYLIITVIAGVLMSRRAGKDIDSYFLGGKKIPWYFLGIANASGMFDITGTMWMVALLFVYGLKSIWIPWLWPTFNQIFLMIYLAVWLRRSNVMTGAEWIRTRFGDRLGGELSHISVVFFALVSVIGFLAYAFQGIGKFTATFFPWDISPNTYALVFMTISAVYVILGGMYSVVLTDLIQFTILTIASVLIACIAVSHTTAADISAAVPAGWEEIFFNWRLDLDWAGLIASVNTKIGSDGWSLFTIFFMMVLFKGILASMAGPAPNYDMQKILSTRSPKEAALMSWCTSAALFIPRYLLIAGIAVLGLVYFSPDLIAMGSEADIEQVLPYVIGNFLPVGLVGFTLAGLLAAFMSTFDCTVNCGASYITNDIYKRYINPGAKDKTYVYISYICSILVVVGGIGFGFLTESIHEVTMWIVAGLYAGYIVPNVLKWHWWRLNGYGYFAGMITGTVAAIFLKIVPGLFPETFASFMSATDNFDFILAMFPLLLILSTTATVVVTLLTPPENDDILKKFYKQVRPWGFWKPIHQMVIAEEPAFRKNTSFKRDTVNLAVGIVWQLTLAAAPIYLVIRQYKPLCISIVILLITSVLLKKNWFDKLEKN